MRTKFIMRYIGLIILFCLTVQCTKYATDSSETQSKFGFISGYISYPSESIPKTLVVFAEEVESGKTYEVTEIDIAEKSYKIKLPIGRYFVFAQDLPSFKEYRSYYTEFVTCGLRYDCESHEKIQVEVKEGVTEKNINPQDWYDK